jgi:hypothetical protein
VEHSIFVEFVGLVIKLNLPQFLILANIFLGADTLHGSEGMISRKEGWIQV